MKWFYGTATSTNAEGKFEYQEPKLLKIVRLPECPEGKDINCSKQENGKKIF